jgi:16S rRNA (guanine527-N7)-methyltransferase
VRASVSVAARIAGGADAIGVSLDPQSLGKLDAYLDLLDRWARTTNLTGFRDVEARVQHVVLESLALLPLLPPDIGTAIDIGSGAGVPGLPLQIAMPGCTWTLVEPRPRRAAFLREAVDRLGLPSRVMAARVERVSETFDLAASRAWKAPNAWFAIGSRLVRQGGWLAGWAPGSARGPGHHEYHLPDGTSGVLVLHQSNVSRGTLR